MGTPAIGIMTTEFVDVAKLMGQVLGLSGYRFAVIEHPVSSAKDDRLRTFAEEALRQGVPMVLT